MPLISESSYKKKMRSLIDFPQRILWRQDVEAACTGGIRHEQNIRIIIGS